MNIFAYKLYQSICVVLFVHNWAKWKDRIISTRDYENHDNELFTHIVVDKNNNKIILGMSLQKKKKIVFGGNAKLSSRHFN